MPAAPGVGPHGITHGCMSPNYLFVYTGACHPKATRFNPKIGGCPHLSEELLALIERCLAQAGIEPNAWRQSVPEPPVRLPQSDYRRMNTRVYLEKVSIKQRAAVAHHLHEADSTLEVSAVNLTNRENAAATYDVDLLVSYNVFAPQRERRTGGTESHNARPKVSPNCEPITIATAW